MSSKMWNGPCAELIASHTDPLAMRLHRRAGKQGISYTVSHNGRSAEVHRMIRNADGSYSLPLVGVVSGGDPLNTFVNAALQHTEHDSELFELIGAVVLRRTEAVEHELIDAIHRVTGITDAIESAIAPLKARHD